MALKENTGSSITERAVDHIGVASDPTDVCHTCKYVTRAEVEYILSREKIRDLLKRQYSRHKHYPPPWECVCYMYH